MKQGLNILIGERVKYARNEAGLKQEELSAKLGFKDRQILSNIESGIRKISPEELLSLMKHLHKTLEYFTDPYLLIGENMFSWRANRAEVSVEKYENKMKKLVSAFRQFSDLLNEHFHPIIPTLAITEKSSYEEATGAAERLVVVWGLGDVPSERLMSCVEKELNMHLLFVDTPSGISGAACHMDEMNMILINRNDPAGRRNFDLAHEIFHLLTWNDIQPEKIDVYSEGMGTKTKSRREQLADNFAAALLMPKKSVNKFWKKHEALKTEERVAFLAKTFGVSGSAMFFRLKNLKLLSADFRIGMNSLKITGDDKRPRLYSETFVKKIHAAIDKGLVSVGKVADLLDCTLEDMEDLFKEYGKRAPFEI